ncbi:timeless protein-domain-containing protein [Abortiporus biennis]|nr:timeless protein-domain-containing protein [Abortiporus biennis]
MNRDEPIEIPSDDDEENYSYTHRRAILEPAIRSVVEAVGGFEGGNYRLGDECLGCLKDLKKYLRKDDTDDERTVARILYDTLLLPNDLVPVLMETAGKGLFEDKRAIACVDLMTGMTWPIDMGEELKELDEVQDKGSDYTQLISAHLHYKASVLKSPEILQAMFGIVLACLAKNSHERKERDVQIINVVLYLVRNLAFIKDLPMNSTRSSDLAEFEGLQMKLIKYLDQVHFLQTLLTIASNAESDPMFNTWNTLVLEIFYLLVRGVNPSSLALDQTKQPTQNLQRLLAVEDKRRRDFTRNAATRHSRFGTTISVSLNPNRKNTVNAETAHEQVTATSISQSQSYVLHRQSALHAEASQILDMSSSKRGKKATMKGKKIDEVGREGLDSELSLDARKVLRQIMGELIERAFNPFVASLIKDIKSERAKVTEKDNLRLLFLTKWVLEFFGALRAEEDRELANNAANKERKWAYGYITEVVDRNFIGWLLKRMREAQDDKPKLWTELQAGIECLTQLLQTIDALTSLSPSSSALPSSSLDSNVDDDAVLIEPARVLQHQIIYNGTILDLSLEVLRTYKEGNKEQSLRYLDAIVGLGYGLLRMLERWSKRGSGGQKDIVRQKTKKKRKTKKSGEGEDDANADDEEMEGMEEEVEETVHETMFTFDAFEARFAHSDITQTLLLYLSRYHEFDPSNASEKMKKVVSLLHRQGVKAKAEGLFFKVSTLDLFKGILAEENSLPKEQPYKDLVALIKYLLRQFFKAVEQDSFVLIQAFFPKNRGRWKEFSSWEPEPASTRAGRSKALEEDTRFPPDVEVKKGYKWSEQLGIALGILLEEGKQGLVDWVKQILMMVIGIRQRIVEETDGENAVGLDPNDVRDEDDEDEDEATVARRNAEKLPSSEAISKFTDYLIPYDSDEKAEAATKDPHLKLVFRLIHCFILDEDADELEWYIPAAILPPELQRCLNVINQYLDTPFILPDGKKATSLLQKKRRRRRRRRSPSLVNSNALSDGEEPVKKKKKEKKKKEEKKYKSAQFIVDSDEEFGNDDDQKAFFEKEKKLREKTALAAISSGNGDGGGNMRSSGTKKRTRKGAKKDGGRKKRKVGTDGDGDGDDDAVGENNDNRDVSEGSDEDNGFNPFAAEKTHSPSPDPPPKPKPHPKPRRKVTQSEPPSEPEPSELDDIPGPPDTSSPGRSIATKSPSRPTSEDLPSDDEDFRVPQQRLSKKKTLVLSDDDE